MVSTRVSTKQVLRYGYFTKTFFAIFVHLFLKTNFFKILFTSLKTLYNFVKSKLLRNTEQIYFLYFQKPYERIEMNIFAFSRNRFLSLLKKTPFCSICQIRKLTFEQDVEIPLHGHKKLSFFNFFLHILSTIIVTFRNTDFDVYDISQCFSDSNRMHFMVSNEKTRLILS